MITLENTRITDAMLNTIRFWQEDEALGLAEDLRAIDNAITFIACEHKSPMVNTEKEALAIISTLSFIKRRLRLFEWKEVQK